MFLWTPAEAKEYFESKGARRPDSQMVARRALEPPPPKTEAEGPKRVRKELLLSLLPDCGLLAIYMDGRNKKRMEKAKHASEGSSP
mmetsp:Transcript_6068/g.14064  ORF Transcript_6068/g.14064 Transcript_6068/m.14064 type:complete len:86 (-) Transcript_6068:230-487(-)|eukprot:CAMPEP_0119357600 /NCGR_PEP_ID=MMETSP1334-20130426/5955_1 /TAXON_ID=127549 /ORGANISM="Calcidiscus leptoporus, Strain RCC1130" /LENGTH=85 /DNA_ID=CAMNT_0007371887 /DNA_START=170 /DNA_END=427 /DNA_ORIENTATION=+